MSPGGRVELSLVWTGRAEMISQIVVLMPALVTVLLRGSLSGSHNTPSAHQSCPGVKVHTHTHTQLVCIKCILLSLLKHTHILTALTT